MAIVDDKKTHAGQSGKNCRRNRNNMFRIRLERGNLNDLDCATAGQTVSFWKIEEIDKKNKIFW